jgi:hypothetical protein
VPARIRLLIFILALGAVAISSLFYLKYMQGDQIIPIEPPQFPKIGIGTQKSAEMKLVASAEKTRVGTPFSVSLLFTNDTPQIAAFDAVVSYDPDMLRVDEIVASDIFSLYPRKKIEDFKQRFIITGVQTDLKMPLKSANGELATISITPLKSGTTRLDFVIEGDKYTNIVNSKPENILRKATGVEVNITE